MAFIFTLCVLLAIHDRIGIEAGKWKKAKRILRQPIKIQFCCWNIKCPEPDCIKKEGKSKLCACIERTKTREKSKEKFDD